MSIILLPIENLPVIVLLNTLNPAVLWLHEPVPIGPVRVLNLDTSLLIGIPLLETDQLVEVSQHIDEHTAIYPPLQKILYPEVDAAVCLEDVHHLADNVLEIEF